MARQTLIRSKPATNLISTSRGRMEAAIITIPKNAMRTYQPKTKKKVARKLRREKRPINVMYCHLQLINRHSRFLSLVSRSNSDTRTCPMNSNMTLALHQVVDWRFLSSSVFVNVISSLMTLLHNIRWASRSLSSRLWKVLASIKKRQNYFDVSVRIKSEYVHKFEGADFKIRYARWWKLDMLRPSMIAMTDKLAQNHCNVSNIWLAGKSITKA